jgi:hypothetical protein
MFVYADDDEDEWICLRAPDDEDPDKYDDVSVCK